MIGKFKSNWKTNSAKVHLERLARQIGSRAEADATVLSFAPADFQHPQAFSRSKFKSLDSSRHGDFDFSHLPFADGEFNVIFCVHALEHAPDSRGAVSELARVLKPGGRLWLTAPFFYMEHEPPNDYSRFTQFGLRPIVESTGLKTESLQWLEGYCGSLAYAFRTAFDGLPVSPRAYGGGFGGVVGSVLVNGAVRPSCALFASLMYWLDVRHRHTGSGHCRSYLIEATKR